MRRYGNIKVLKIALWGLSVKSSNTTLSAVRL